MKLNNVRVHYHEGWDPSLRVFVDGKEMTGVLGVDWDVKSWEDGIPQVTLTVVPAVVEYYGTVTLERGNEIVVTGHTTILQGEPKRD